MFRYSILVFVALSLYCRCVVAFALLKDISYLNSNHSTPGMPKKATISIAISQYRIQPIRQTTTARSVLL